MSDLVGRIITNKYRVDQFLGRGGMADVYKVWDTQRAAFLAMKILHDDLADDQVFLRRFRREAQTLAKLKHPNIVGLYGLGQDGELVFMLMEYVEGTTLGKVRNRLHRPFTPAQILGIAQPVCSALHFAHRIGYVHCDIKPANIMIEQTGRVLLADFGISRVTEAATATMVGAGTPAYMSPEQVSGDDPAPQMDIYALGVVLFELATGGERPFTGEKATITGTIAERIRWEQRKLAPPSPTVFNRDISPQLEAIILRCLAKDPKRRYASVTALLDDLSAAVGVQAEPLPATLLHREDKSFDATASSIASVPGGTAASRRAAWIVPIGIVTAGLLGIVLLMSRSAGTPQHSAGQPSTAPTVLEIHTPIIITATIDPASAAFVSDAQPTEPPAPTVAASVTVSKSLGRGGYFLQVDGGTYAGMRYGPLPDGSYKVGQNGRFAVYVDQNGMVYGAHFGNQNLIQIHHLQKKDFWALRNAQTPDFQLELITDDNLTYTLVISELSQEDDHISFVLDRSITQ